MLLLRKLSLVVSVFGFEFLHLFRFGTRVAQPSPFDFPSVTINLISFWLPGSIKFPIFRHFPLVSHILHLFKSVCFVFLSYFIFCFLFPSSFNFLVRTAFEKSIFETIINIKINILAFALSLLLGCKVVVVFLGLLENYEWMNGCETELVRPKNAPIIKNIKHIYHIYVDLVSL